MRAHPFPDFAVIFGKIAFCDAGILPVDAIGMAECNALNFDTSIAFCDWGAAFFSHAGFIACGHFGSFCLLFVHDFARRFVLTQALKRSMPHHAAMGPATEFDLCDQFRLDPDGGTDAAFLRRQSFERCTLARDRFEGAIDFARALMCETGAGASGIAQLAALVDAEHQRADGMGIDGGSHKAGDDELLAVGAFGLDPVVAAPGAVLWPVRAEVVW